MKAKEKCPKHLEDWSKKKHPYNAREKAVECLRGKEKGVTYVKGYDKDVNPIVLKAIDIAIKQAKKEERVKVVKTILEAQEQAKQFMRELSKHRCMTKTGNWCLDCEILNAKGMGILIVTDALLVNLGISKEELEKVVEYTLNKPK